MQIIARLRVALGFTCGVLVFWLATPTPATIAAGLVVAVAGEAIPFLGRRSSEQVARGDAVRAVPVRGASALRRVVGDWRGPRDRVRPRRCAR